jgi:Xaa-Pro aminopeptidase
MVVSRDELYQDIDQRIERVQSALLDEDYDALIVFGNNRVNGSLRYLTDYFPDRCGWTGVSASETFLFQGAALVVTPTSEPVLLLDPGLTIPGELHTSTVIGGGFSSDPESSLSGRAIADLLADRDAVDGTIGIETWDRFPAPLSEQLEDALPNASFRQSTIVEEQRFSKTDLELEIFDDVAEVADMGNQAVVDALEDHGSGELTELDLIREAERTLREADPIYENFISPSPSFIATGTEVNGSLFHHPQESIHVEEGDVIHWDLCMRHQGYSVDTSRTRVLGGASAEQRQAHEAALSAREAVLNAIEPGVSAAELVEIAKRATADAGHELLWGFLGHGVGLETHERPDLVREETDLEEDMILAIEPRVQLGNHVLGAEDLVRVTPSGGTSLTTFDRQTLEI